MESVARLARVVGIPFAGGPDIASASIIPPDRVPDIPDYPDIPDKEIPKGDRMTGVPGLPGHLEVLQALDHLVSADVRGMATLGLLDALIADPMAMERVAMLARIMGIPPKSDKRA